MNLKTLSNSFTVQPSVGRMRMDFDLITEETSLGREHTDPNASVPLDSHAGRTRLASKVLGPAMLAVFLGVSELEPISRSLPEYYIVRRESGSSYDVRAPEADAREEVLSILSRLPVEGLEDGMTFDLGINIITAVNRYHELALTTLAESILGGDVPPEMASHALRWLGRMKDPETEGSRVRILSRALQSSSPTVRDGAALGLAAVGKRESVAALRRAYEMEEIVSLRRDIKQVMRELEPS